VRAGEYRFVIASAGSCTLLLQTLWPALMLADGESRLTLGGGTHSPARRPSISWSAAMRRCCTGWARAANCGCAGWAFIRPVAAGWT
jgi:hypothetical protein